MTGMENSPDGKRPPPMQRLRDYLELAGALVAISGIFLGALWWLGGPRITSEARDALGVTDLSEQVAVEFTVVNSQISEEIGEVSQRIDNLEQVSRANGEAIAKLSPPRAIVIYDKIRSRVHTPCGPGSDCAYQMRVRRSQFGLQCGKPWVVARYVTDRTGLQYPVEGGNSESDVVRVQDEWTLVTASFFVPGVIVSGVAEYFMVLGYECGGKVIEEETIHLIFEITS